MHGPEKKKQEKKEKHRPKQEKKRAKQVGARARLRKGREAVTCLAYHPAENNN